MSKSEQDFLFFSSRSEEEIEFFIKFSQYEFLNVKKINKFNYFSSSNSVCISESLIFFGDMYSDENFIASIEELSECMGGFVGVNIDEKNGEKVQFCTDYFGFGIIYLYRLNGITLVTNSLSKALHCIHGLGGIEFSQEHLEYLDFISLPSIQQPIFDSLPVTGLTRLPLGYIYTFVDDDFSSESAGISLSNKYSCIKYEELIRLAVDEVASNIKHIWGKYNSYDNLEIDMSGGKDSRLLLAACGKVKGLNKKILFNTRDDKGTKDLDIVCLIANDYKIKFNDNYNSNLYKVESNEVLNKWIDYYYSEYCRIGIPSFSAKGGAVNNSLSGGGGEAITKTANVEWLRKYLKDGSLNKIKDYADLFIETLKVYSGNENNKKTPYLLRKKIEKQLEKQLENIAIDDFDDYLNNFYLRFRNRVHFGMNGVSVYHGKKLFFPLQSKYLYSASQLLSPSDRASSKVIYDFIKTADSNLLKYPFASSFSYWEKRISPDFVNEFFLKNYDTIKIKKKEWLLASEKYSKDRLKRVVNPNLKVENKSAQIFFDEALRSIDMLSSNGQNRYFNADLLCEKLVKEFNKKESRGIHMAVFLIGMSNYINESREKYVGGQYQVKYSNSLLANPIKGVEFFKDSSKDLTSFKINVDETILTSFEYAVYFYSNGEIIERIWYRKESVFLYPFFKSSVAIDSIRVFVKKDFQVFSKLIKIDDEKLLVNTESEFNGKALWENFTDGEKNVYLNEKKINLLIKNSKSYKGVVLIGFHGAIEKRNKINPPYYYFRGVSDKANIPLISISDPSLELSDDLNLAWYLGDEENPLLPKLISNMLDCFILKSGAKLILAGGSGGGFSALNIQSMMTKTKDTFTFAWNPQIYTYQYNDHFTRKYLKYCFPDKLKSINLDDCNHKKLVSLMKELTYCEVLQNKEITFKNRLILINGFDNNHLRKQIRPFVSSSEVLIFNNDYIVFDDCSVYFGEWGYGHVAPPRELVVSIIREIADKIEIDISSYDFYYKSKCKILKYEDDICLFDNVKFYAFLIAGKLLLRTNMGETYKAYQWQANITNDKEVVFKSGYILGSNVDQVFFDLEMFDDFNVYKYSVEFVFEDFFGNVRNINIKLNTLIKPVKLVKPKCKFK